MASSARPKWLVARRSTTRRSRPRSSRSPTCCDSRRRRSGSTSPSTRSLRSAPSCGRRPTPRSPSSSGGVTARTSSSAGSSARCGSSSTKRGEQMVFLRLDDVTGGIDCVVFAAAYAAAAELCATDRIVIVKGRVDHKEGETKLVAQEISAFESVEGQARGPAPDRRDQGAGRDHRRAGDLLRGYPGESPVLVDCVTSQGPLVLRLGPRLTASSRTPTSTPRCERCSASRRSPEPAAQVTALILRKSFAATGRRRTLQGV